MSLSSSRGAARHSLSAALAAVFVTLVTLVHVPAASAALEPPENLSADNLSGNPILSWDRVEGASTYLVKLSTDPAFGSTLVTSTTVNNRFVPTTQLPTGRIIYWRLWTGSSTSAPYAQSDFIRAEVAGPTAQGPLGSTGSPATLQLPRESLVYEWTPVRGASSYTLEVSDDPDFAPGRVTTSANIKGTRHLPTTLPTPGVTYVWRVRAELATGISTRTSVPEAYRITPPDLPPQPVEPANSPTESVQEVVLAWRPIDGAVTYNLQVSTRDDFETRLVDVNVKSTRYSPPITLLNDQYYWRVQPVNADNQKVEWGQVPVWQFRRHWPEQPRLQHPADGATVGDPFFFQWSGTRLASRYYIELSSDPLFNVRTTCWTVHTTFTPNSGTNDCAPTAPGTYYWRVVGVDDRSAGATSPHLTTEFVNAEVHSFTYLPEQVTLTAPAPGAAVTVPTMRWEPQAQSEVYKVTLTNLTTGTVTSETTPTLSWTPPGTLTPGGYRWQVQSQAHDGRLGAGLLPQSQRTFTLEAAPTATASSPDATSPSTAGHRFPALSWTPVANATSYKLQVRRLGHVGWNTLSESFKFPAGEDTSASFLAPGTYEWQAVAYAGNSQLAVGNTGQFEILPFETVGGYRAALTGTDLSDPASYCQAALPNECQDLRQTPVLRWNPQPETGYYMLYVSRDKAMTNLLAGYPKTVNQSIWMNPVALPDSQAGSAYYWHVVPCTYGAVCAALTESEHAFNKRSHPVRLRPASSLDRQAPQDVTDNVRLRWDDYLDSQALESTNGTPLPTPSRVEAKSYRVQVATDQQFTKILDDKTVDQTTYTSFGVTYPDGPIYWRVQAIDSTGNALAWSDVGQFTKSSPTPAPISPSGGTRVSPSEVLRWSPLDYAGSYKVEVYKDDNSLPVPASAVATAGGLKQTSWAPTTPLPSGDSYRWRVKRVDAGGKESTGWSPFSTFRVGSSAPLLQDLTTQSPTGAMFRWTFPDDSVAVKTYRFTASWSSGPATAKGTKTLAQDTVAPAYAPVTSLADGVWTWRVAALDTAGKVIGTSQDGTFTISGAPHGSVQVTGPGTLGTLLSVTNLVWDTTSVTTSYQWFRGATPIPGASTDSYRLTAADYDREVWVRVTGKKAGYPDGVIDSFRTDAAPGPALLPVSAPRVTGTAAVGQVLTADPGTWTAQRPPGFTFRWLRDGAAITGASTATYRPAVADAGRRLQVRVTARAAGIGDGTATSAPATVARMSSRTALRLAARTIKSRVQARAYATVTAPAGAQLNGTLSVYDGTRRLSSVTLKATHKGRATVVLPRLGVGRHSISLAYAGTAQVAPSRSPRVTLVVVR